LINVGSKLTFFVWWRRVDFRVKVVRADTVDDGGFLYEELRSVIDEDIPLNGQDKSDEEKSPSVVDELLPDRIWEF